MAPVKMYGKLPRIEKITQTSDTIMNPSRFPISRFAFLVNQIIKAPANKLIPEDIRNPIESFSPYNIEMIRGKSINAPSTNINRPITRKMILRFID